MNRSERGRETAWHRGLLAVVLVFAACARFYALDKQSLNFYGLSQLVSCDQDSWLALINHYVGFSGLPPFYPALLCTFTDWLGRSDFIARAPAALAGIGSVYLLYLTGRDFLSATAGLLAAALLAMNYQILLFDREVSMNSLLMLCLLAHGYCFCRLFFYPATPVGPRPFLVSLGGQHSTLRWEWAPALPFDGRFVVGFWVTAALCFYTSGMAVVVLLAELATSAFFLLRHRIPGTPAEGRHCLRGLWLPVAVMIVPWLPIWSRYIESIKQGYILGWETPAAVWGKAHLLFPLDPALQWAALFLAGTAAGLLVYCVISRPWWERIPNRGFLFYVMFLWGISLPCLFAIQSDYSSYAYVSWLTVLVLVLPLAMLVQRISSVRSYHLLLTVLVLLFLTVQVRSNYRYDLYARTKGSDFRLAARIINEDENFQNGNGVIIRSAEIFDHYLNQLHLTKGVRLMDNRQPPDSIQHWLVHHEFYYLDLLKDGETETEGFRKLASQYPVLCLTRLPPRVRLAKFSSAPGASATEPPDCRVHLNDHVTLAPPSP